MKPKNSLLKILMLFIVAGMMNITVFPRVFVNGAGGVYGDDGNTGGIQEVGEKTIEMYIVEGSGYYLGAAAGVNNILQIYEVQDLNGVDFYRFNRLMDQALINMDKAITTYETLIMKAESTPYNKEVLEKLSGFDYYAFMTENRLNKEVLPGYLSTALRIF